MYFNRWITAGDEQIRCKSAPKAPTPWLEAIALRLEAIPIRLEALEAIGN